MLRTDLPVKSYSPALLHCRLHEGNHLLALDLVDDAGRALLIGSRLGFPGD